jgi:predicted anti-sigma-YlaC factor YlaD
MIPGIPDCKETARLLSESLDHRLPLRKQLLLKIHLIMCKACENYKKQLFALKALSTRYFEKLEQFSKESPESLSDEAKETMKTRLRQH